MHFEDYVKDRADEARAETKAEYIASAFNSFISKGYDEEAAVSQVCEILHVSAEEVRTVISEQQKV